MLAQTKESRNRFRQIFRKNTNCVIRGISSKEIKGKTDGEYYKIRIYSGVGRARPQLLIVNY